MSKYFVMAVDSLVQTFTVLDCGQQVRFSCEQQGDEAGLFGAVPGDRVLGCRDGIQYVFQVMEAAGREVTLEKLLEVQNGVSPGEDMERRLAEGGILIPIGKREYQELYRKLLERQMPDSEKPLSYLYDMGNKEFAFETVRILKEAGCFTREVRAHLLDQEWCQNVLKNNFPILRKVPEPGSTEALADICQDENQYLRYYREEIVEEDENYVITNNWLYEDKRGRDTRTPYIQWIQSLLEQEGTRRQTFLTALSEIPVTAPALPVPHNYLVFGAPGTGKSFRLRERQQEFFPEKGSCERITVYAGYTYAGFVGTYKPKMEKEEIVYAFVPGPFTRTLVKALRHPDRNFLLIVEEINRANPAAVFGDVFQLLDREEGRSEYPVAASEDLCLYLAKEFVPEFDRMEEEEQEQVLECCREIRIPSNMYIWATMNSADQGVFPLDTAFKRRWDYDYIGIDENAEKMADVCFLAPDGEGETVKVNWNRLREALNRKLAEKLRVNEDKLLGPFFLSGEVLRTGEENLAVDNGRFLHTLKSKVFMYLFEDAARQRRRELFCGCEGAAGYSGICEAFDRIGIQIFGEEIRREVLEEA